MLVSGKKEEDTRGLSRKERERRMRREAILHAAREVFERDGFHSATMMQFFPNKQTLFAEVIISGVEEHMCGLREQLGGAGTSWQEQFRRFIAYKLTWVDRYPDFQRLMMETVYTPLPDITPHLIERFREIHMDNLRMLQGIFLQASGPTQSFDAELMAMVVMGSLNTVANEWYQGLLSKRPTDYILGITRIILGGNTGDE